MGFKFDAKKISKEKDIKNKLQQTEETIDY